MLDVCVLLEAGGWGLGGRALSPSAPALLASSHSACGCWPRSKRPATGQSLQREECAALLRASVGGGARVTRGGRPQIRELDKMIKRLKQGRRDRQTMIDEDEHRLAQLDKQCEAVEQRYRAVCERLSERERTRDRIKSRLEETSQRFAEVRGGARRC